MMSKLEDLVPDRKLCEQIPDGCFENTALAWDCDYERWYVAERETVEPAIAIPAPTLEEILSELILFGEPCCFWQGGFYVRDDYGNEEYDMVNASTAGLKLWLRLNKSDLSDQSDQSDTDRKGGEQ